MRKSGTVEQPLGNEGGDCTSTYSWGRARNLYGTQKTALGFFPFRNTITHRFQQGTEPSLWGYCEITPTMCAILVGIITATWIID